MSDDPRDGGPRLIGVGVGPGNPEYLTLQAVRVLEAADVILVPATEGSAGSEGRAEAVVCAACPQVADRIRRIPFSMGERRGVGPVRAESWRASARAAIEAFEAGARTVAFATIGDPSVYSTFSYLRASVAERMPAVGFELVPGITAMQALAAAAGRPLVEGREVLALVPATIGPQAVGRLLDVCDSVTIYKAGRTLPQLREEIVRHGRQGVVGVDVSLPGQELSDLATLPDGPRPYFSAVLVTPERTTTGGSL
ncbi:precorrin-2 C(20)-methyltransferase [Brooklawnia cerclae]|uniref:Precorrin-2/cobalt-factor-2 C20-methyltransferase n=1 Tax=Brooklawnia cerclae TaxID=349934 RepID=A0ABX0SLW1_9ACTN|nr:precorrin-2/cobalt-factor-2 C20-methyltransferase [Brooklawnia cerclae]